MKSIIVEGSLLYHSGTTIPADAFISPDNVLTLNIFGEGLRTT